MNELWFLWWRIVWSFERSDFYRDLADAMKRRVSIRDFLERSVSNATLLKKKETAAIASKLLVKLSDGEGMTISGLFNGVAPKSDQVLFRAVDGAGSKTAAALEMCADSVEFRHKSLMGIAEKFAVPLFAVPIVGALSVITSQIIAGIAKDTPASIWIGFNGFVRDLAEFINDSGILLALGFTLLTALTIYLLPNMQGRARIALDKRLPFSLYRDYNAAMVVSSLAILIHSGRTMKEALEDLRGAASPWLRWQINKIILSIEVDPSNYMAAFSLGLMPLTVRTRLASLLDSNSSFVDALQLLGGKESASLQKRIVLSATALRTIFLGFLLSIALVLSLGVMTIGSALSNATDPSKLLAKGSN
ncbi:hypothetical protein [Variovorax ginsengisoli]|uniref:Toxin coregulated pilus biosynthesis protein E n=1 Tax=Variovorax ginsengisoli TaxID=363844 RepID=A0ABT9SET8_9BURK|nr:hypothetical protein [Variovorax ginsengisoli]MDP9902404.1 hypothetical protein [Variovorax ginsengisoli]